MLLHSLYLQAHRSTQENLNKQMSNSNNSLTPPMINDPDGMPCLSHYLTLLDKDLRVTVLVWILANPSPTPILKVRTSKSKMPFTSDSM